MKRAAILDLGTNTFNLLIVEKNSDSTFDILVNKRIPVKLGESKINSGEIIPVAYKRGIEAIETYSKIIGEYQPDVIKAFGTSAFRTANNGKKFLSEIKEKTALEIEIIPGEKEAELIYLGVKQSLNFTKEKFLILDIGGGSNELIIADMEKIYWKKSYPLGIARLIEKFLPSDPLSADEISKINAYLAENLQDLFKQLKKYQIEIFVGASGSFETFLTMLRQIEVSDLECILQEISTEMDIDAFCKLHKKLEKSTLNDRMQMKGLEPMRIEMIVLASLFVKFILDNHNFKRLIQSNYSLKEGAVTELIMN
ncbi:MAG: hypothetical protein JXA77_18140 [Bacteroidales bacterium]|nr:hypothetical protein [Bacteroidales bacterium]MBN2818105.1 hypothetical protein [Bacteroidales bacterium]